MKRLAPSLAAALALPLSLAACDPRDATPGHLYWSRDLLELAREGTSVPGLGSPIEDLIAVQGKPLQPDATGVRPTQGPGQDGLAVTPAFVEGQPAAYVTSEVWYEATPVWLQPLYVLVTAYDEASPGTHAIPGANVFGVGPETPFYSPFWRVVYVVVPAGTPAGRFRSEKALLDAKLAMHPGGLQLCIFLPGGKDPMGLAAPAGAAPKRP